jgi:uncharacterized membrane protein YcaP (DUF421 family)
MLRDMFDPTRLGEVALRTCIIYLALLLFMRVAGKREVGQMKPFDLVTLLIISNAVQNAMVGQDSSVVGGLTAALLILVLNFVVSAVRQRFKLGQQVFEGSPTLLVYDGQFLGDHMQAEGLVNDDVLQAMREHGIDDLAQVKSAVLEVDGSISIIQRDGTAVTKTRRRFRRQSRL